MVNGTRADHKGYAWAGFGYSIDDANKAAELFKKRNPTAEVLVQVIPAPVGIQTNRPSSGTTADNFWKNKMGNAAVAPVSGTSGTTGPFLSAKILKALPTLGDMTTHAVMRWAGITEDQISAMSDKSVAGFAKRVETAYNVAKTKYGKNMAEVVSTMVKPYEQWGLEEYNSIREFSAFSIPKGFFHVKHSSIHNI